MNEASATAQLYPKPGEVVEGKYEIQRVLGTGAMGAVFRATHLLRKAPVALKFMSPAIMDKPGIVDRFLNEGVAASQIDSAHVVKVLDVSKLPNGQPYLVLEYLEGEDLGELLERETSADILSVARCVFIVLQILRGLQVAHRVDVIHRDMKPANCFVVRKDGEPDFIKIVDFGISKLKAPGGDGLQLTADGAALGTPLYMSLEQARNPKDVDARADLYSVAAILYEMLSGVPPFVPESGAYGELLLMLGSDEPQSLEEARGDLPEGFWGVVYKGLAKQADDRYQSAAEMAEALAPYADGRADHVLKQLLRRAASGVSIFPPHPGPPTEVDEERPSARSLRNFALSATAPTGAGLETPAGPALPFVGTEVLAPDEERDAPDTQVEDAPEVRPVPALTADTAAGAVRDVGMSAAEAPTPSRSRAWAVVAAGLVAAVAVVGWQLNRAPTPDETGPSSATPVQATDDGLVEPPAVASSLALTPPEPTADPAPSSSGTSSAPPRVPPPPTTTGTVAVPTTTNQPPPPPTSTGSGGPADIGLEN
ncbi:MAG: protein kinase [Deltaproteobacteria bacterium]|nr:protein kinase [Deltaproteobacteria bacterium]